MRSTRSFAFVSALLLSQFLFSQNVGINVNGAAPNPSAMLDIDVSAMAGTKTGLLIPRMASTQRAAIPAPATGLMVYDTSTDEFWYFDGANWVPFLSLLTGWSTTGNAGTVDGTNFIGTTDNVPFNFRVNGIEAGRIGNAADGSVFLGLQAGLSNTIGNSNTAIGYRALESNTSGSDCVAIGRSALMTANGHTGIVAIGDSALASSNGNWNTGIGWHVLKSATSGYSNVAVGYNSQQATTTGYRNTSVGTSTMTSNTDGIMNSSLGYWTLLNNTSGHRNAAFGAYAGRSNTTGHRNTYLGMAAGENNTIGAWNTYVGYHAGSQDVSGNRNTYVGYTAGYSSIGYDRSAAIGHNAQVSADNSLALGGTGVDAVHVGIGVTAPAAELEVNGYTMLGSTAPAVQMRKYTGTTAGTQGGSVSIAHGLDATKILAIDINIHYTPTGWVPTHYTIGNGFEVDYYYTNTLLYVRNVTGNSANVLSDAFTVLITYEE